MEEKKEKTWGVGNIIGNSLLVFVVVFLFVIPIGYATIMQVSRELDERNIKELQVDIDALCIKQNFEEAHKKLAELKVLGESYHTKYGYYLDKVVREEAAFLISRGDEESAKRVIFLLNQTYGSGINDEEPLLKELLELATAVDNQYMADYLEKKLKEIEEDKKKKEDE